MSIQNSIINTSDVTSVGSSGKRLSCKLEKTKIAVKIDFYPVLFLKNDIPENETDFKTVDKNEFTDFYMLADGSSTAILIVTLIMLDTDNVAIEEEGGFKVFTNDEGVVGEIVLELENEKFGNLSYSDQKKKKSITINFDDLVYGATDNNLESEQTIKFQTTDKIGSTKISAKLLFFTHEEKYKEGQIDIATFWKSYIFDTSCWLLPDYSAYRNKIGSRVIKKGMNGWNVLKLQWLLSKKLKGAKGAYHPYQLSVIDGDYGGKTSTSLTRFGFANYYKYRGREARVVDELVIKCIYTHINDYKDAINQGLGAKVDNKHSSFNTWLQNGIAQITELKSQYNTTQYNNITPEKLWKALMAQEAGTTHWENNIITLSHTGAVGICQVQPFNCKRYNNKHSGNAIIPEIENGTNICPNLYDPRYNIMAGTYLFNKDCLKKWKNDNEQLEKALATYNGGPGYMTGRKWQSCVEDRKFALIKQKNKQTNNLEIPLNKDGTLANREKTQYPIKIKKRLGLTLKSWEQDFLDKKVILFGLVKDVKDKKIIKDVEIKIGGVKDKTNAEGKYSMKVTEGKYKLEISHKDYEPIIKENMEFYKKQEKEFLMKKKIVDKKPV